MSSSRTFSVLVLVLFAILAVTAAASVQRHAPLSVLQGSILTPDLARAIHSERAETVDVVLNFRDQVEAEEVKARVNEMLKSSVTVSAAEKSDFVARELVHQSQLVAEMSQRPVLQFLAEWGIEESRITPLWIVNSVAIKGAPVQLLADLVSKFGEHTIEYIEMDHQLELVRPVKTHTRPLRQRANRNGDIIEENLNYIEATNLWQMGYRGKGLVVAVVDTGVDAVAHPALKDKYRGKDGDHNYNWYDPYGKTAVPYDSDRHGSHCTGTILGSAGNETVGHHYFGVAPDAEFIACMGLKGSTGTNSNLKKCWEFVLAPTDLKGKNPDPSRRAHITSNSWGGPYNFLSNSFKKAAEKIRAAGIFNAVAAGNSGRSGCQTIGSPAVFDNVFAVGAIYHVDGQATSFSSRGPVPKKLGTYNKPDAMAPGQDILSTVPGGYASFSGTSMATPHIAGAVALLWDAVPELARDVERTEQLLRMTALQMTDNQCNPPQPVPNFVYGYGNVKLVKALEGAKVMLKH